MRYLSLFSGIEAASVAWAPLGWECVGVAEIASFPKKLLELRFPSVPNLGDISKMTDEMIDAISPVDLVVGGFPCQDLSISGKQRGLKNSDGSITRSGLFFDAMRIVRATRARWVVLENVPGMLASNAGEDFRRLVREMVGASHQAPYGWRSSGAASGPRGLVEWRTLDARHFGNPQQRKRTVFVGDFGDWRNRRPVLLEPESLRGDSCALGRSPDPHAGRDKDRVAKASRRDTLVVHGTQTPLFRKNCLHSITKENGGRVNVLIDNGRPRFITPLEAERAFGFPDGWTDVPGALESQRYAALGNSMSVGMMRAVGERIAMVADQ